MYERPAHIILVGKMGSGKTTRMKYLVEMGYKPMISYTTRPIRKGETDGIDYNFVTDSEYDKISNEQNIISERVYETVNGPWRYGMTDDFINDFHTVGILDPDGYMNLYSKYKDIFGVYVDVPKELRYYRTLLRGDDTKEIDRRFATEDKQFEWFDNHYKEVCQLRIGQKREANFDALRIQEYITRSWDTAK